MKKLEEYVRSIPDFPEPGIIFRDITTILQDPDGLHMSVDRILKDLEGVDFDVVVGPESRGFIFGVPVAYALHKGFVPVRKKGKLPCKTVSMEYDLEYVIPEEGTNLWLGSWGIPANAENKENAEKWIDFMCRPDIAKRNFEYITYPTPNKGAFDLLDPELQENKAVFPDISSLKGSETFQYLGDDVETIYNDMWKEVKAAK